MRKFFLNLKFLKSSSFLALFLCIYTPLAMSAIGSITDPGFSSEEAPSEESFFGSLKGSARTKMSRSLRWGSWEDSFSQSAKHNLFDTLLIKMDLSLSYPLAESFSAFERFSAFKDMLLFMTVSYRRPVYDVPRNIEKYCYKSYFCFEEVNIGVSDSLLENYRLESQYSVYLTVPMTSISSYYKMKYLGLGAFFRTAYPFFSEERFQMKFISSHFFDTAVYGSRYANSYGSKRNDIFSLFNQAGLRFSYKDRAFIPVAFFYFSHQFALDYKLVPFHLMSLGCSAVWSTAKRLQIVAGLSWGGDIFQHEFSSRATDVDFFNADETSVSGGLSYSF